MYIAETPAHYNYPGTGRNQRQKEKKTQHCGISTKTSSLLDHPIFSIAAWFITYLRSNSKGIVTTKNSHRNLRRSHHIMQSNPTFNIY